MNKYGKWFYSPEEERIISVMDKFGATDEQIAKEIGRDNIQSVASKRRDLKTDRKKASNNLSHAQRWMIARLYLLGFNQNEIINIAQSNDTSAPRIIKLTKRILNFLIHRDNDPYYIYKSAKYREPIYQFKNDLSGSVMDFLLYNGKCFVCDIATMNDNEICQMKIGKHLISEDDANAIIMFRNKYINKGE